MQTSKHTPAELRDAFWRAFVRSLSALTEPDYEAFRLRYNNQVPYRVRNCRPRTDLMTKGKDAVLSRTIAELIKDGYLPGDGARSPERFMDLLYFAGNWWAGTRHALLAIEVENNWGELRGTFRDLLQFQAAAKIAVFYYADAASAKAQVLSAVREVTESFLSTGFEEAASTAYLIVVAPNEWPQRESAKAPVCCALSFTGISNLDHGIWLLSSVPFPAPA